MSQDEKLKLARDVVRKRLPDKPTWTEVYCEHLEVALAAIEATEARVAEMKSEAAFLIDRIMNLDQGSMDKDTARDLYGHVMPSVERLRTYLKDNSNEQR